MRRPSPVVIILLTVIVGVGLVAWQKKAENKKQLSPPESALFAVLRPLQIALTGTGNWLSDIGRVVVRRGSIVQENDRLRERLAAVEGQNRELLRLRRENDELRKLQRIAAPPNGKLIAAEVASLDATDYARMVRLSVGRRQGVREKDVVLAAEGVVGQVVTVDPNLPFSNVLLLTDPRAAVGAITARSRARGLLRGTGQRLCRMSYLDVQADVREGDLVLTSGDSTIFPKGLVLGRVMKVQKNKTYSQMTADIDPAVSFDRLYAVKVRVQAGP